MTRFNVSFDGIMDRLEELERENHRLIAERDARHQQVVWRNARIDELQTMIDAMRPMVEAVARMTATTGNGHCDSCNGQRVMIYDAKRYTQHISDDYEHAADCPIAQARAFVAAHPTAGEAESEGE